MAPNDRSGDIFSRAVACHRAGRLAEAQTLYRLACNVRPGDYRAHHLLGVVTHALGLPDAIASIDRAIKLSPRLAAIHNDKGVILAASGKTEEACKSFGRALSLDPKDLNARRHLAHALRMLGRLEEAGSHFEGLAAAAPDDIDACLNLALILKANGNLSGAASQFEKVLTSHPRQSECYLNLAEIHARQGNHDRALAYAHRALEFGPKAAGFRNNLGNVYRAMGRHADAVAQYDEAIRLDPDLYMSFFNRGLSLRSLGMIAAARQSFIKALERRPDFLEARLAACMANLLAIYQSTEEMASCRASYEKDITELNVELQRLNYPASLADAIGSHQPFYLPYQAQIDVPLQQTYGLIATRVMEQRYQPCAPHIAGATARPIKIGIVSGFFRRHSNWRIPIKGWIGQLNRERHTVVGYHTGSQRDAETELASATCAKFVEGLTSLDDWRKAILSDAPDVLIYPEIGMDKISSQLAAQRLAGVQCCSWGHPVTSGLATIDHFLSSDFMEPPDAQAHYTENLVRLPNLSVYCEMPSAPVRQFQQHELNLRSASIKFWCCQSLPKYMPEHDDVFPRIALEVGDCQFAFIEFPDSPFLTDIFLRRMEDAFARHGLNAAEHCVMLPRLTADDFLAAMGAFDIVLDSIGWSGCNSTLDSLVHNLPIVTSAGKFMRGRHTAAVLEMMNMGDTVAEDLSQYVVRAGSLGREPQRRKEFSDRIAQNKHRIYEDTACIRGLETFLAAALRS
ncbi:MAG TPA: tetratricopeptide repeat protein [Bradyrhizobium sp.]|jgi:predicted O-linked N-acetylglucosamine transferase (SPINDLY family)